MLLDEYDELTICIPVLHSTKIFSTKSENVPRNASRLLQTMERYVNIFFVTLYLFCAALCLVERIIEGKIFGHGRETNSIGG